MSDEQTTTNQLKAWKPAVPGLESIAGKATSGVDALKPYQGSFNAPVSQYTQTGLNSFLDMIRGLSPTYGQGALQSGDYLSNKLLSGGYQPERYDTTNAIQSATRPLFQQYNEQTIPGIQDAATVSGAYGSSQNSPGTAKNVLFDQAGRNFADALTNTAGTIDYQAFENYQNQKNQANQTEATVAGGLPSLYNQGAMAAALPSQLWGQAGAIDQNIAQQPLNEAQQRSNYDNSFWAQALGPLNSILQGQGSTFGTQTQTQQLDPVTQALQMVISGIASVANQAPGTAGPASGFSSQPISSSSYPSNPAPSGPPAQSSWYNPFSWGG